jgi:hypothetical protein
MGQTEDRGRKKETIGDHDEHVGTPGLELRSVFRARETSWLRHGEAQVLRSALYRTGRGVLTATLRPVRLSEYSDELEACFRERVQRGQRELGGPGEGNAQATSAESAPAEGCQ